MHLTKINSNDRNSVSDGTHSFTIDLPHQLEGKYQLVEAVVPITFYTVDSYNNTIYFYENSTNKVATIEDGTFDTTTILTAVKSALDTASGGHNTYTVTYTAQTGKLTISASNAFYFTFGDNTSNSAHSVLGFTQQNTSSATSITGDAHVDLTRTKSINILLDNQIEIVEGNGGCTFSLPITGISGDVLVYSSLSRHIPQCITFNRPTKRLTVRLLDDNYLPLDIINGGWTLTLACN